MPTNRIILLELIPGWVWKVEQKHEKQKRAQREWGRWFKLLHEFVAYNKRVPAGDDLWHDGLYVCKIGKWCDDQQRQHNENLLSAENWLKLGAVPGWKWANKSIPAQCDATEDEIWAENLEVLRKYVTVYKTLPARVLVWNGRSIGRWAEDQLQKHCKGHLSAERIAALESVSLWKWWLRKKKMSSYGINKWNEWLKILHEYVKIHQQQPDQLTVWTHDDGSERKLGKWVSNQRQSYKRNLLSQAQINALETVPGWYWVDPKYKKQLDTKKRSAVRRCWDDWYKMLDEYVKINSVIPNFDTIWNQHGESWYLGTWVVRQRSRKRQNLLAPECVAKLDAVPGWRWE
jgi:hypothetical protein